MKSAKEWVIEWRRRVTANPDAFSAMLTDEVPQPEIDFYTEIQTDARADLQDRDGNWIDKWGSCRVCDGEIPYGHGVNCDIYRLEVKICIMKAALNKLSTLGNGEIPGNSVGNEIAQKALKDIEGI